LARQGRGISIVLQGKSTGAETLNVKKNNVAKTNKAVCSSTRHWAVRCKTWGDKKEYGPVKGGGSRKTFKRGKRDNLEKQVKAPWVLISKQSWILEKRPSVEPGIWKG